MIIARHITVKLVAETMTEVTEEVTATQTNTHYHKCVWSSDCTHISRVWVAEAETEVMSETDINILKWQEQLLHKEA